MNPTAALHAPGQNPWLDNITRRMPDDGTLARCVDGWSVAGIDLDALAAGLQADGATAFGAGWNARMAVIAAQGESLAARG